MVKRLHCSPLEPGMNSPSMLGDPIVTLMSVREITRLKNLERAKTESDFERRRAERSKIYSNPNNILAPPKRSINIGDSLGTAAGIVGAASYFNPILAPVAAVGGIGYGTYKLGQSFNLW